MKDALEGAAIVAAAVADIVIWLAVLLITAQATP